MRCEYVLQTALSEVPTSARGADKKSFNMRGILSSVQMDQSVKPALAHAIEPEHVAVHKIVDLNLQKKLPRGKS